MNRQKSFTNKHQIISEYLTGNETFEALGQKYNVNSRTIQSWVRTFRLKNGHPSDSSEGLNKTAKELNNELKEARLKNELLEEMLRLSEEQTGIDFRKKFGTRQS